MSTSKLAQPQNIQKYFQAPDPNKNKSSTPSKATKGQEDKKLNLESGSKNDNDPKKQRRSKKSAKGNTDERTDGPNTADGQAADGKLTKEKPKVIPITGAGTTEAGETEEISKGKPELPVTPAEEVPIPVAVKTVKTPDGKTELPPKELPAPEKPKETSPNAKKTLETNLQSESSKEELEAENSGTFIPDFPIKCLQNYIPGIENLLQEEALTESEDESENLVMDIALTPPHTIAVPDNAQLDASFHVQLPASNDSFRGDEEVVDAQKNSVESPKETISQAPQTTHRPTPETSSAKPDSPAAPEEATKSILEMMSILRQRNPSETPDQPDVMSVLALILAEQRECKTRLGEIEKNTANITRIDKRVSTLQEAVKVDLIATSDGHEKLRKELEVQGKVLQKSIECGNNFEERLAAVEREKLQTEIEKANLTTVITGIPFDAIGENSEKDLRDIILKESPDLAALIKDKPLRVAPSKDASRPRTAFFDNRSVSESITISQTFYKQRIHGWTLKSSVPKKIKDKMDELQKKARSLPENETKYVSVVLGIGDRKTLASI